jgi:hypothetical protein
LRRNYLLEHIIEGKTAGEKQQGKNRREDKEENVSSIDDVRN